MSKQITSIPMPQPIEQRILDHLRFLYGTERAPALLARLHATLTQFRERNPQFASAKEHLPQ